VTQGTDVTIFRGGVEPWLWSERVVIRDPSRADPSRQVWGEQYEHNAQRPIEWAIFVIGHEDWHVRNPRPWTSDAEDQMNEWEANERGRRFLERWRNRKKP
jgi:hypothetical protein